MRVFLIVCSLVVFGFFWLLSTPVYFANDVCLLVDRRLSEFLDNLFDVGDGNGGGHC